MKMTISRRKFLDKSGKAGIMLTALGTGALTTVLQANKNDSRKICVFSKHLQWLDYDKMAKNVAELGFNGIDLTVRPKGHVLPENVARDLPRAFEVINKAGIETVMITTAIKDASDPKDQLILKTAGDLGIPYYRMGWFKYDKSIAIQKNLEKFQVELQKLAEINQKYNIRGAYQNHAGDSFGSPVWDLGMILDKISSPWLGCQYDIRHATVEGAKSWPVGLKYLARHINTIDIKDFIWKKNGDEWRVENVPLGKGIVDFDRFFAILDDLEVNAPLSIHYEYDIGGAEHGAREIKTAPEKVIAALKQDLIFLKKY